MDTDHESHSHSSPRSCRSPLSHPCRSVLFVVCPASGRALAKHCRVALVGLVIVFHTLPAWAWGPHTEITAAALAVLADRDRLKARFGNDWNRIAKDYCWMGDWREAVRPDHYADDYLLFPGMATHLSHMLPDVRQTYVPYFRRALQALRTESPQNGARWVGSLLHFVQDSGSPPHTIGVGGPLHSKMERWVDESRLLGTTDAEAERGFLARMEGLIEFSRVRAEKLRPIAERLTERENQPLELECALETARASADILHTLFTLGAREEAGRGGILEGKLPYDVPTNYARVPAKVLLAGTNFSTTADAEGRWQFRALPAGKYTVQILATGYELAIVRDVEVADGNTVRLDPALTADPIAGNRLRNARFELKWLTPDRPDGWRPDPRKAARWTSALVRVPVEAVCKVSVAFLPEKQVPVLARWRTDPSNAGSGREVPLELTDRDPAGYGAATISPDKSLTPFEPGFLFLELVFDGPQSPDHYCRHAGVTLNAE
jgi:hypothetical protein